MFFPKQSVSEAFGSFPKPWSISVILNRGLGNQNTSREPEHSAHLPRLAPPDGRASFGAPGDSWERASGRSCTNMYAVVCVFTLACARSVATESSSTFPVFWHVGAWGARQEADDDACGHVLPVKYVWNPEGRWHSGNILDIKSHRNLLLFLILP